METRLPASSWPSARTATGTFTTSGRSGSPPWARSHDRRAPQLAASTTSLIVVPKARFTAFRSSKATSANATDRCGVSAPLKGVAGASKRPAASARPPRWARAAWPTVAATSPIARIARSGLVANERVVSAANHASDGSRSGVHVSGGGTVRPSGVGSKRQPRKRATT